MGNISYKVLHIINGIIALIAPVIAIYTGRYILFFISYIYIVAIEIALKLFGKSLILFLLTLYLQVVGPIEMLIAQVSPVNVWGIGSGSAYSIMQDDSLYWHYLALSVLMYYVIMCSFTVFRYRSLMILRIKTSLVLPDPINSGSFLLKYTVLFSYAVIIHYLRSTFSLDVPGQVPTIPFAGVIVYLYRFVGILLMFRCASRVLNKDELKIKDVLILFIDYFIICIPDLTHDRRAPLIYSLLIVALCLMCLNWSKVAGFVSRHRIFITVFIILFLFGFAIFTSLVRYKGQTRLSILYIFSRLTGVADGFMGYSYLSNSGQGFSRFSLMDYFINVLNQGSISANSVYTHEILGYSSTAIHGSALPLFVGSLMYSGIAGLIMISIIFGYIYSFADRLMRLAAFGVGNNSNLYAFVGSYICVYTTTRIMGGGSELLIELFILPTMLLLFYSFIKESTARIDS